jgi:hypothetical protein
MKQDSTSRAGTHFDCVHAPSQTKPQQSTSKKRYGTDLTAISTAKSVTTQHPQHKGNYQVLQ